MITRNLLIDTHRLLNAELHLFFGIPITYALPGTNLLFDRYFLSAIFLISNLAGNIWHGFGKFQFRTQFPFI